LSRQKIAKSVRSDKSDFGTYGSRVTTLAGNTVRLVCGRIREDLLRYAAESLGVEQSALAYGHYDAPCDLPDPETGVGDFAQSYSFGVHAVEVEVDPETGQVKIHKFVAATDCGNLINPPLAESQVEGGVAQGIGYALMEDLVCYENGQVLNPHLSTYRIPTAPERPPITALWVETDDPRGPYGAKGLGEMGLVPTAPAVVSAIRHATGAWVTKLPMTPERVLEAIEASRQGKQG
jgi:putative selenate reductase molybdopterin-binding subunit